MKRELKDWFVPWLLTARKYDPSITLDNAWANPGFARMMINESPFPPSEKIITALTEAAKKGNWYPGSMKRLRTKIGNIYNLATDNVALCNGSSEAIDAMMRIFLKPDDEIIISTPTFGLFPPKAEICGGKVVQIPLKENDLQYDVDAMFKAINNKTKLIVIINPNNPTGIFIDDNDLKRLCEAGIPLCIDEAYRDYNPDIPSKAPLIKIYPHVFLSATLSKAHGIPGIRFGFVIGNEEMINAFRTVFLPWNVSLLSAAAAEAVLDNPDEIYAKVKYNNRWMKIFFKELQKLGLNPFPAHGNYMLVDATMTGKTTAEIIRAAIDMEKIYLNSVIPIHGKDGYFRLTPGSEKENERFLKFAMDYFRNGK